LHFISFISTQGTILGRSVGNSNPDESIYKDESGNLKFNIMKKDLFKVTYFVEVSSKKNLTFEILESLKRSIDSLVEDESLLDRVLDVKESQGKLNVRIFSEQNLNKLLK